MYIYFEYLLVCLIVLDFFYCAITPKRDGSYVRYLL